MIRGLRTGLNVVRIADQLESEWDTKLCALLMTYLLGSKFSLHEAYLYI